MDFLTDFEAEHIFAKSLWKDPERAKFLRDNGYQRNMLGSLLGLFSDEQLVAELQNLKDGDPVKETLLGEDSRFGVNRHQGSAEGGNQFGVRRLNTFAAISVVFGILMGSAGCAQLTEPSPPQIIEGVLDTPLEPDGGVVTRKSGQIYINADTIICKYGESIGLLKSRLFFSALDQKWTSPGGTRVKSTDRAMCKSGSDILYILWVEKFADVPVRDVRLIVWQADSPTAQPKAWWFGGWARQDTIREEFANSQLPQHFGADADYSEEGGYDRANELMRQSNTALADAEEIQELLLQHVKEGMK